MVIFETQNNMNMNKQRTEKESQMNKVVFGLTSEEIGLTSEEIELVAVILNISTMIFLTISFIVGLYFTICLMANYFTSPAAIKATKIVIVLLYLYSVLCGVGQFGVRNEKKINFAHIHIFRCCFFYCIYSCLSLVE